MLTKLQKNKISVCNFAQELGFSQDVIAVVDVICCSLTRMNLVAIKVKFEIIINLINNKIREFFTFERGYS